MWLDTDSLKAGSLNEKQPTDSGEVFVVVLVSLRSGGLWEERSAKQSKMKGEVLIKDALATGLFCACKEAADGKDGGLWTL
jgi:hypothetical protein